MSLPAGSSGVPDCHARRPGTVPRLEGVEGDIRSPPGRGRVLLMVDITALEDVTDEANATECHRMSPTSRTSPTRPVSGDVPSQVAQRGPVLFVKIGACQALDQIRTYPAGSAQRLVPAVSVDPSVIAAEEDGRNLKTSP